MVKPWDPRIQAIFHVCLKVQVALRLTGASCTLPHRRWSPRSFGKTQGNPESDQDMLCGSAPAIVIMGSPGEELFSAYLAKWT